ncbi:BTAD domain-containing putative transcriptional regulator [Umezawaea sp. NPDC059074]|uniref:AfsR/SARP family transcriptional regulator n=1 Tax=Umezawaea sp. NPDC059074 TaxID=3346716 RepID=UPI00369105A5
MEVAIPAAQQRIILAGLLLYNNRVVSIDRIAWFLWGENLPPSAVPTIRTYVMRLRRTLGPRVAERIITKAPGYMINVGPGESDLATFFDLHGRAVDLATDGRTGEASSALSSALALWRDAPLLDVPSPTLQDMEVPPLLELRMQTLEWWIDLELGLGRHARLVPELSHLVRAHPLRETLTAQLMLALHGAGRQSDALAAFLHTRNLLIEQLGSEPGHELRHVQRLILRTDGGPQHTRPQVPEQVSGRISHHNSHLENRWRLIGSPSFGW